MEGFDFGDNGRFHLEFVMVCNGEVDGVAAGGAAFAYQGACQGDDFVGEVVGGVCVAQDGGSVAQAFGVGQWLFFRKKRRSRAQWGADLEEGAERWRDGVKNDCEEGKLEFSATDE